MKGQLYDPGKLCYAAELLIAWRNGLGLPCSFYDLDMEVAITMLALQNEAQANGLW